MDAPHSRATRRSRLPARPAPWGLSSPEKTAMRRNYLRETAWLLAAILTLPATGPLHAGPADDFTVGLQKDGSVVVPTNQVLRPAGKQVTFPGRPVDLVLTEG